MKLGDVLSDEASNQSHQGLLYSQSQSALVGPALVTNHVRYQSCCLVRSSRQEQIGQCGTVGTALVSLSLTESQGQLSSALARIQSECLFLIVASRKRESSLHSLL